MNFALFIAFVVLVGIAAVLDAMRPRKPGEPDLTTDDTAW